MTDNLGRLKINLDKYDVIYEGTIEKTHAFIQNHSNIKKHDILIGEIMDVNRTAHLSYEHWRVLRKKEHPGRKKFKKCTVKIYGSEFTISTDGNKLHITPGLAEKSLIVDLKDNDEPIDTVVWIIGLK